MGRSGSGSDSSSGEEDGDADWRAAINSAACSSTYISSLMNGFSTSSNHKSESNTNEGEDDDDGELKPKTQKLKHYQVKDIDVAAGYGCLYQPPAQKLLDEMLENTLEFVKVTADDVLDEDPKFDEGGIRLFKHAPPGIVFDHIDELEGPKKKPRLLPGEEIDEKSKKFKTRIHSVVVEGKDIIAAARTACEKSLARLEAKDAAAKAAAKREEERVKKLKETRGERYLPSIAREMQIKLKGQPK